MSGIAVRIIHREPGPAAGELERLLADARLARATNLVRTFASAGADDVRIASGPPDDTPFGARLRELVRAERPAGLVVLGSGSTAAARPGDLRPFIETAAAEGRRALANNRYSADLVAVSQAACLLDVPDLPSDNALPRWLEEAAGYDVADLRSRWRLQVDLDSPLDVVLVGGRVPGDDTVADRLAATARIAADRRAEILVAGRTGSTTLRWLERHTAARVRALVEERGLRAASRLSIVDPAPRPERPPASVLGILLERDGPDALGAVLARLADAALVDSRVLLAHRLGSDEAAWPPAEDRFASDLLLAERVSDPWLRALTTAAREAPIPVVLGGHTLVAPGIRLALRPR